MVRPTRRTIENAADDLADADDLIARYIETDPDFRGADRAWIVDSGVRVPVLILSLRGEGEDVGSVAEAYQIPEEAD